jgi:hypothetical protein
MGAPEGGNKAVAGCACAAVVLIALPPPPLHGECYLCPVVAQIHVRQARPQDSARLGLIVSTVIWAVIAFQGIWRRPGLARVASSICRECGTPIVSNRGLSRYSAICFSHAGKKPAQNRDCVDRQRGPRLRCWESALRICTGVVVSSRTPIVLLAVAILAAMAGCSTTGSQSINKPAQVTESTGERGPYDLDVFQLVLGDSVHWPRRQLHCWRYPYRRLH